MSRFFVPPENIGVRTIEITDPGDLHHMRRVLRLRPGDEVDVSDTDRWEYHARIEILEEDSAMLTILDKQAFAAEPKTKVTLYQGIPKQGKLDGVVQKCTELGIREIVPVFMDRTVVADRGNMGKKAERWRKIAAEAVKQCRRGIIPDVRDPVKMEDVRQDLAGYDLVLIPYENEEALSIKEALQDTDWRPPGRKERRIALFIGPEGGFSDEEVYAVCSAGGRSVSLGRTILRTETAGPAALAMIMYELEL